ncbi:hypothetical protein [Nitratifractor sp.]|uniref:TlpA family protein disulfide reductase n=1 Tax=Nitratifractor sp. TaxID=2268144 RepID=UPI0025D29C03|nr:hypothetical protein [Nitratifractor sp.]
MMRTVVYLNTILVLFLLLAGCGQENKEKAPRYENNRTELPSSQPSVPISDLHPHPRTFHIRDIDNRKTLLEFQGMNGTFRRIRQPIVILTLLSDRCAPCRGMLPYLGRLQRSNDDDLFLIGILLKSDLDPTGVRRLMRHYESNFFLSIHPDNETLARYLTRQLNLGENYPLPLTLIFKNGKYVMNIQGAVPYEMLQTLVDQLKKPQEKKE